MPRRSSTNSDGSPIARRVSARIAAVQAVSPPKSNKTVARKRQSTKSKESLDDSELQLSQSKSEISSEEINGIESNSISDGAEPASKIARADIEENVNDDIELNIASENNDEVVNSNQNTDVEHKDFEVIDHSTVPLPDSDEVKSAISVQGDDGQLLVGFVQVDKTEIPEANSAEIKQISSALDLANKAMCSEDNDHVSNTVNVNGNDNGISDQDDIKTNGTVIQDIYHKVPVSHEVPVQSSVTPASGDVSSVVTSEMIVQH